MLNKISSFSGPLAKLFKVQSASLSLITSGLILQWEIGDVSSYTGSGSTIEDMTTNNTDGVIVGTTNYGGRYLLIQGSTTEYVRTGDLNSYMSPANTGTSISVFLWVYPTTNGIILTEEGTTTADAGGWYDTQIQKNSAGNYLFSVWPYDEMGTALITSSATYSLNNWNYVGYSYDGTTMRAYVNGTLVGSSVVLRESPGNFSKGMYYYVGYPSSTNMVTTPGGQGLGPASTFRFGAMQVYNRGINATEVLNNYNTQKDAYASVCEIFTFIGNNATTTSNSATNTANGGWVSSAYSLTGYTTPVSVTFQILDSNQYIMGGFSYSPTAHPGNTYVDTSYGLYIQPNFLEIYENGNQVTVPGSMTNDPSDIWKVEYNGVDVKYYKNNTLIYTSLNPVTQPLRIFFPLLTANAGVTNVCIRTF